MDISVVENLQKEINGLYNDEKQIVNVLNSLINQMETLQMQIKQSVAIAHNAKYELLDPRNKINIEYPNILDGFITLDKIISEKCSMARFGDGEFAIMSGHNRQHFQEMNKKLGERLIEVINSNDDRLLIGIADNYGNLDKFNQDSADTIRTYMSEITREEHMNFLDINRVYYDAYVTRPYALYKDNCTDAPKKRFEKWKKVWDERNVIVVEGAQSRLGVGNDLFENALSVKRILAPATNSFSRYDEILKNALNYAEKDILFLIALGPSAGVLAYDLHKMGYQALDIGHLDLEYEWFLAGKGKRVPVPNKYNNEYPGDEEAQPIKDKTYERQIVADCSY